MVFLNSPECWRLWSWDQFDHNPGLPTNPALDPRTLPLKLDPPALGIVPLPTARVKHRSHGKQRCGPRRESRAAMARSQSCWSQAQLNLRIIFSNHSDFRDELASCLLIYHLSFACTEHLLMLQPRCSLHCKSWLHAPSVFATLYLQNNLAAPEYFTKLYYHVFICFHHCWSLDDFPRFSESQRTPQEQLLLQNVCHLLEGLIWFFELYPNFTRCLHPKSSDCWMCLDHFHQNTNVQKMIQVSCELLKNIHFPPGLMPPWAVVPVAAAVGLRPATGRRTPLEEVWGCFQKEWLYPVSSRLHLVRIFWDHITFFHIFSTSTSVLLLIFNIPKVWQNCWKSQPATSSPQ